jgi:N-sulfoglucosamine sulfohydrolase
MPNRRDFCASSAAAALTFAVGRSRAASRLNLILITADDLGPQLGCYGDGQARSPHLDQLAADGVMFTHGWVTQASCSPSRSSMFTGLYPHQNGQLGLSHRGYSMTPGWPTLPKLLHDAGYRTGVIGKIHVAPEKDLPFDVKNTNAARTSDVQAIDGDVRKFLAETGEQPFFLMLNYVDPHRPFHRQIEGLPQQPRTAADTAPFPFLGLDTPTVRDETAGYYNGAERVDHAVGLVRAALRDAGRADDTVILFIGDHGPPFTRGKTTCYEAALRIPYLVYWPGNQRPGTVCDRLVSTVDILPTFCAAAGIAAPESIQGRSLAPLLSGDVTGSRDYLCGEYNAHGPANWFPRRAITDGRYKLIQNLLRDRPNPVLGVDGCKAWGESRRPEFDGTPIRAVYDRHRRPPAEEFFDLEADPYEFVDLSDSPAHAATLSRLRDQLNRWRRETADPLLDPDELARQTAAHDQPKEAAARG